MELSIVIVNFNVKHFLEQALISIQKAIRHINCEVFVVDNASQDASVAMVRQKFPWVKLIVNTQNLGFAVANNQALKLASGKYIACINPDTIIQEDTFITLIQFFETHPEVGMAGCKILNPDGTLQLACRRSIPTPWVAFTKISGLSKLFPKSKLFGQYNLTYLDPDQTSEVEAISGSFMLIRRTALDQVGYFDETWFMYAEDLDLCYRFRQAGWKIYYLPSTKIIHFKGESSKESDFDTIRLFYQAMRLFVAKYHKSKFLQVLLIVAIGVRAGVHFIKHFLTMLAVPFIDLILMNAALVLALLVWFGHLKHLHSYLIVTGLYSTVWLGAFFFSSCYSKHRFAATYSMLAVISGLLVNASLTFFFNQIAYSRAVVLIAGLFNFIFLPGWRLLIKLTARWGPFHFQPTLQHTLWDQRTLLIGSGLAVEKLISKLQRKIDWGYEIVGIVSFDPADIGKQIGGIDVLGTVNNLSAIIKRQRVRDVIFSTKQIAYDKIMEVMHQSKGLGINYRLVPDNLEVIIGKSSIDHLDLLPLIEIDNKIDRPVSIVLKRSFDIFISFFLIIITSPWLLYLRCLRGIPLKRNLIRGVNGEVVPLWEFDSPKAVRGKFLPCLFSVLVGDVSLVGTEIVMTSGAEADSGKIFAIKPGLTGLNRIAKQENLNESEKQRRDLYYMKNYSLILDIEIILKTIFKI